MSSLSRSEFPPRGWEFYSPQTRWHAPLPLAHTFDQQVTEIIKHRRANPGITAKHKLAVDRAGVGNELENYTRARLGIPAVPKASPLLRPPVPVAAGAAAVVKRIAAGGAAIIDWLSSGKGPVQPEVSARRAARCVGADGGNGGKPCPKHVKEEPGSWFMAPVAALIKRELAKRSDLNLSTPHDEQLRICGACSCEMRLKVHAPSEIIQKHLRPEARAELWGNCWILWPEDTQSSTPTSPAVP